MAVLYASEFFISEAIMLWLVMTIRETTFQLELHFNITNYQTGELAVFFNVQRSTAGL